MEDEEDHSLVGFHLYRSELLALGFGWNLCEYLDKLLTYFRSCCWLCKTHFILSNFAAFCLSKINFSTSLPPNSWLTLVFKPIVLSRVEIGIHCNFLSIPLIVQSFWRISFCKFWHFSTRITWYFVNSFVEDFSDWSSASS